MVMYGNVHFVITCLEKLNFIKEFVGNQNFIFRIVAMILCLKRPTDLDNT